MRELQILYDSRVDTSESQWGHYILQYSHTRVVLTQVEEGDYYHCGRCDAWIPPICFALIVFIHYKENTLGKRTPGHAVEHRYCKDCCMQDLVLDHYGSIDWDNHVCDGSCTALHITWRSPNVELDDEWEVEEGMF